MPFERLRREDVQSIARHLIENVFRRDGLVNRGVKLIVEESALNLLVEAGYHPQLGARALKRVLERQVTVPIAAQLSATTPDQPLVIFLRGSEGKIAVDVSALTVVADNAAPLINLPLSNSAKVLDHVEDALDRIEQDTEALTHRGEVLIGDSKSDLRLQLQNFQFRDQMRRVGRMLDRADQRRERQPSGARRTAVSSSTAAKRQLAKTQYTTFDDKMLGQDLQALLLELKVSSTPFGDDFEDYLQDLIRETSLLELMAASLRSEESTQTLLTISVL